MPIVQVKGGPAIRFPDSMSQDEIFSALDDLTERGEFDRTTQSDPDESLGVVDSLQRAGRNVVNSGVEFAASLVDTPAIIGEFARNIIPVLNDSPPLEEMTLHKAAEWIRSFEMSHDGEEKPEGVQGFLTDTLPGMAGSAASLLSAAGIARKALPVAVSAALGGAAAQGVSGFRSAREAGATDEQQFQSWMVNSGIGVASAVPISRWLSLQPNAKLLSTAITEGSVNAAVGFFQQLATNIADQQIYDKDRPWMQGVGEATAGGLTIGGLMGLTMAGMAKQKPKTGVAAIKDPALNAASKVVETSGGTETAKAIAELDASREAANAKAKSDPIVDDPSHVISPESQAVLNAEQLKAELEANPIEEVVKLGDEPVKPVEEAVKVAKPLAETLSAEDKASPQAKLDAELDFADGIEPVEIPKPIDEPKVTGRTAPPETNRVLKRVKDEIARLNKMFGNLIDNVIIQDIPDGAGIASAARSGDHKTIALDPVRLAEAERTGASIKDLVREEVIHSLQGKAVRDMWTKLGEPGKFRDYWDKHFTELANEMSDAQKEWINKIYGSELKSPIQQAVEFVRATLQERYSGRISEAGYSRAKQPALTNLLNVFREFWNGFKGKKGEVGKLAKQQMQAIDNLLREGRKNVKRVEPKAKPEVVETKAKPLRASDKSVRDHTISGTIKGDVITMSTSGGPKFSFSASEISKLTEWERKGLIEKQTSHWDEEPGGAGQADRLRDSVRSVMRQLVDPKPSLQDQINANRKAKQNETTRSNSTTPDVGSQALVSNVEGNQAKPAAQADAGDAGKSKDAESASGIAGKREGTGKLRAPLPDEAQVSLYDAASQIADSAGLDDVTRDFAFDFIQTKLHEKAEAYLEENGSMDKFATSMVAKGLLKDFYKKNSAKKRSGDKVSLDAPIGDEGEASAADTIGAGDTASGDQTQQQRTVEVMNDHIKRLPAQAQEVLNASLERGGVAGLAKKTGIPENTLRSRLKVAEKQLVRELLSTPEGREVAQQMVDVDDLVNAASPTDNPLLPDESKRPGARNLDWWTSFKRGLSPDRWAYGGRLIEFANTTDNPFARGFLMKLGRRIERLPEKNKELHAKSTSGIFEVLNTLEENKAQETAVKNEWEMFFAAAESRDGGRTAAESRRYAMTYLYPNLSPKAKAVVDFQMQTGVWTGQVLNSLNGGEGLIVKEGNKYRKFKDAGENYYQRKLGQDTEIVLNDPDAPTSQARFEELMDQLMANNPKQFPDRDAAIAYWKEKGRDSIASGNYYAGVDMARGVKLPDSWHDYTLDTYLKSREDWAERVAQIWAFGQDAPAEIVKGEVVRPALMNAFDEAIKFATAQTDGLNGEKGLKVVLGQIRDDVFGTRQSHAGDEWIRRLRSLGTIRYLSAVLSSVRNVGQGIISTAEQAGARRAILATSRGLYDASRAIYKSAKAGRFIEPKQVEAAASIGAFQRSVSHQSFYDLDPIKPAGTAVGKAGQWLGEKLLLGQHLSEGWNRGMSAAAFGLWSRDAVRAFAHNPNSAEVIKARAQLQRWGFGLPEQAKFFSGDTEMVNRFIRTAVHEKQFGYKGDQVPAIFRAPGFQLLTLFQSWGVQRTRDFTRNVWRPMFYGEKVNLPGGRTVQVRDPMPMIRFIVGSMAGTAALNWLKDEALGRKLKDPSWEEILNAGDQETSLGVKMALGRVANDLTASGGMGLVPDYLRSVKDWTTQGRSKSLANSPAIQIAADLTDLIKAQVGREGDPRAYWRDFRDILLLRTPIAREVNDFSTRMLLFGEDAKTLFDSRQTINTGRAFIKRWTKETGRDNLLKQHSFTGGKTPNSETYDQIYENILEGDTVRAGELVNEYTNNRRDRKKLSAVQASIRGRTPLAGEARLSPQEMREFITWAKSRNPEAGAKIEGVINSYHRNVNKLGFR